MTFVINFSTFSGSNSVIIVLLGDFFSIHYGAETLLSLQCTATIRFVCVCDHCNVCVGQFAQLSGNHGAELTGINKQCLSGLLLAPCKEPQGYRNLRGIEKLGWHRNNTLPLAVRSAGKSSLPTETQSANTAPTTAILRLGSKAVMPVEQGGTPQRYALSRSYFNGEIHARKGLDHRGGIR